MGSKVRLKEVLFARRVHMDDVDAAKNMRLTEGCTELMLSHNPGAPLAERRLACLRPGLLF